MTDSLAGIVLDGEIRIVAAVQLDQSVRDIVLAGNFRGTPATRVRVALRMLVVVRCFRHLSPLPPRCTYEIGQAPYYTSR